ncbi:MAG TPA: FtsX-like permease family protein [Solirubrobacteraceae bacterium]|nr:FtsX-like permease family protein [Solirubrobacteraceae bacterium]
MIGVALKGLAGRKIRALLTAFAVVIGVSMVSGTFILTDTMQQSFNGLFTESSAKTDAVIRGKEIVKGSFSGSGATIPESLLADVRALPEVEAAGGEVSPQEANTADVIGKDGKAVAMESSGGSYDPANGRFSPLALKTGAWADGPQQVVIDAGTAEKEHLELGDPVKIATGGKTNSYELAGTATFGGVDSLGFASIAVWDVETAQTLLGRERRFDSVSIAAKPGTSATELVDAVKQLIPGNLEVKDSAKQAKDDAAEVNEGMSMIRNVLLGFAGIALLVGAFVIFNTLSITVAQRTREFATLRTLGASRKQVLRSVVLEGLVIGLVASLIGLVLGLGIAKGMVALFSALGVDLPDASTVIATKTIVVSMLLGTVITLLACILPARRATRVPPIAAVREGSTLPATRMAAHSHNAGLGVVLASVAAISAGIFAGGVSAIAVALLLGGGVLGLFLGIALTAPRLVKPLARVVGWPAKRAGGVAGELAGANAVRNPGRTASTAAALMIGLTLVTVVAVLGSGMAATTRSAVSDQVRADHVIDAKGGLPFRASEGDALARVPGVTNATHVRSDTALVQGDEGEISGIDPATIADFYRFTWSKGSERSLGQMGADGALVTKDYAESEKLAVGSHVSLTTPAGAEHELVVRGIYEPPQAKQLLGPISMTQKGFDAAFKQPKNSYTFIDADASAAAAIEAEAKGLGDAKYHTGAEFPKDATKEMATMLAMLYVLLGFSVVVSLFGMVNTMVLSVFERTREIGMLRTIGMTRRQARRMIRHESIITALIGAVLGLGLGLFLAGMVTKAMSDNDLVFSVPVPILTGFTLVAVLAGIGAAVLPARRASRLNVLDALHYE